MAIASTLCAAMNNHPESSLADDEDQDLSDMVMPGFRFHPTEEELVEFYLRRKVEGKRFNVELITFLDLYRYDPWELPALAAIGEKEWYFYVPRDRKYRNGDRPNRVTTSGYWKATGADRMIRSENLKSIGLKKTLVFYSGKAPKGIRTSWIMNEYRLPLHETERLQKVEISLCRVYKRAGVEDHPCLPRSLPTSRASSSKSSQGNQSEPASNRVNMVNFQPSYGSKSTDATSSLIRNPSFLMSKMQNPNYTTIPSPSPLDDQELLQSKHFTHHAMNDDLHKLVNANLDQNPQYLGSVVPNLVSRFHADLQQKTSPEAGTNAAPGGFSDRLWEWNGVAEGSKDFANLFK